MAQYENTIEFARSKDQNDPLRKWRNEFLFPTFIDKEVIYFTGNSLGLQPRKTREYLNAELDEWAKWGVEGHFDAKRPWFSYHEFLTEKAAKVVGATNKEVVITHSLTTNIHLLMVSFYRPEGKRIKILCEGKAFPSDQYALQSQAKHHGYDPKDVIVEVFPREGEHLIRQEDINAKIEELGDELAVIMWGGLNYYTGQFFDLKAITEAGHKVGAKVGFDLAHAAGNVKLKLHDWNVDFAAWCTYKYMNSSPGGVAGLFVHENHVTNDEIIRFAGWWGHNKERRFLMEPEFQPIQSAESWQMSNAPIIGMTAHLASLDIFDEVGMDAISTKREDLTAYLEFVINEISNSSDTVNFEIITPKNPKERGSQLSILVHGQGRSLFDTISKEGVIADWREPNVIRIAPVPLYNSYEDCYRFGEILKNAIQ